MHDLLCGRTCDGESPSDDGERRGVEGSEERDSMSGGEHMTRWRCVWTKMSFCIAGNLNASNST